MMEQQVILKNDELQDKWKICIKVTCCVCKVFDSISNLYNTLMEALKRVVEVLNSLWDSVCDVFKDVWDKLIPLKEIPPKKRTYHRCYDRPIKVNTKGFAPPIMRCARSRC